MTRATGATKDERLPPVRWVYFLTRVLGNAIGLGLVLAAARLALGESPAEAAVSGAVSVVPWAGLWVWQALRARRQLLRDAPADLTREQLTAALGASVKGPVPHDEVVRAEATRMARATYATWGQESPWVVVVVLGLLAGGAAVAAVVLSPWWWVPTAAVVLLAVQLVRLRQQQRQRVEELELP